MQAIAPSWPSSRSVRRRGEGVDVGAVVAAVEGGIDVSRREQGRHGDPLVDRHVRAGSRAPCGRDAGSRPCHSASLAISWASDSAAPSFSAPRQCRATIAPLSSVLIPTRSSSERSSSSDESGGVALVAVERGIRAHLLVARQQQLEAVVARVGELVEPDDAAGVESSPAAEAADERVALDQGTQQIPGLLRHGGVARVQHDRRDRAVDVHEDRRAGRILLSGASRRSSPPLPASVGPIAVVSPAMRSRGP